MADNLFAATPPQPIFTPRQIARFFFKPCLDEEGDITGYYRCKVCAKCRKHTPKTGYTNLVSHVKVSHPTFEADMRDASVAATGTLMPWVSQKASNRCAWIKWVVTGNLPLSFCESKETRRYTSLEPISVATLTSLMEAVTKAVEEAIGDEMPDQYGLILDGWTHGTEHYLAVYGCFVTDAGPQYPLLSLAPVMDEPDDQLNAEGHMAAIKRFLPFFVNKRLANLLGVPLVGCASHRLNLAVREYLAPYDDLLEEVQRLARKLRTLKQAAKLRAKTQLVAVLRQDTRWSSTFAMLKRYFQLREFISADDEELADYLPSRSSHRKLETLLANLRDVESVSKRLQAKDLTLLDARILFDALLDVRPTFVTYLAPDADIAHSAVFEQGVVKVLDGLTASLTSAEKAVLEPFLCASATAPPTAAVISEGFAERSLKRNKFSSVTASYMLLEAIPPTSNMVERLFSVARAVLRHERHRLSPLMLEMILFLKINSARWDVATVESCL